MRRVTLLVVLLVSFVLAGCTSSTPDPIPTIGQNSPERAAAALAAGLSAKDLTAVEFTGATGAEVNTIFQPLVSGMGPLKPSVAVGEITRQGVSASAALTFTWAFPGLVETWTYASFAPLVEESGRWKTSWSPTLLHPRLNGTNRLTQRRLDPRRGELLGEDGATIVKYREVYRIGIDKSAVEADRQESSARRLAALVKINRTAYAKKVKAAGPSAFVEAIVLRASADDLPLGADITSIPGGRSLHDEQMLAPNRDFARPIIGIVGEATKEIVDKSNGAVVAGDKVGLTGLQKRYDDQLRGTPGVEVRLVAAKATGPSGSASPVPTPSAAPIEPLRLFITDPLAGKPLTTTLVPELQKLAERVVGRAKPAAALVAIRPSTGAILAAANNPATNGQSVATVGQNPPGSTFKIVTSLALLRAGLTPESTLRCPREISVDGRQFVNYSDFPTSRIGPMPLRTALAQSCNTAFIGQRGKIKGGDLAEAASSLGVGTDYDVGFSSFFGSVPKASSATAEAASMIGQGQVEASPMAMAAVVASVSAGETVVPHLIDGVEAKASGKPLTTAEARQLRSMMEDVVTEGTGDVLAGLDGGPVIGKTGTAEYGPTNNIKTHAWMVGGQDDLAVAVFVQDGKSGSSTAGPLLRSFLDDAR